MKILLFAILAATTTLASTTVKPIAARKSTPAPAVKPAAKTTPKTEAIAQEQSKTATSSLTLLYTASAKGQVRSCNCTKFRFGGYGRELTLLKSIRDKTPNVVLVEGGDAVEWTGFQSELKTQVAARAFKLLGYHAIIPGEDELGRGASKYLGCFDQKSVPIICANYHKDNAQKATYPAYSIVKTETGLKVGLIGLLSPSTARLFEEEDFRASVRVPEVALKSTVSEIKSKSDFIIVVFHGPLDEAKKLAAVKGIGLILCTHRTKRDVLFPDKEKDTNEVVAPVEKQNDVLVINAETNTNWSLGRIALQLAPNYKVKSADHKLFYLDRRYDEDPDMVKIYEEYNTKVKDAVLTASAEFKKTSETLLKKRGLNLDEMRTRLHKSPFAAAETCKECHKEIYEIWSNSKHAHAMATLEKTHQEYDPECVSCHATGTRTRNGYINQKETPQLGNVQCEACHGPAQTHISSPKKGFGAVGEQTCRMCHTDERTPDFDYSQGWAKIMH